MFFLGHVCCGLSLNNIVVVVVFVQLSLVSRLKNEYFVGLLGYCLESNNRILAYEYATMGSLHDVLHGMNRNGILESF